jgi:ABC-2 type transport system ATP-binding protein
MQTRIVHDSVPAASKPEPVIKTESLTKRYGSIVALGELDLEVPRNSVFGFLGPNGAGKTTTMKMLVGLARPTSGRATIFGLNSHTDGRNIRSRVGYLAQDPRFYPHLTARETLRFVARFFYHGAGRALDTRIDETLDLVGLADKAERPTRGFSGGERQRLGIAQAHINHPDLLILDEPAAALDPLGRRDVLAIIGRLREHTTVFYSTHILDDVERVSDHVAILNHGRLVASAPTRDLLDGSAGAYELTLRGSTASVVPMMRSLSWVTGVQTTADKELTRVAVSVNDEARADHDLLRVVLADDDVAVVQFGRRRSNLEEVFLDLVEGTRAVGNQTKGDQTEGNETEGRQNEYIA